MVGDPLHGSKGEHKGYAREDECEGTVSNLILEMLGQLGISDSDLVFSKERYHHRCWLIPERGEPGCWWSKKRV